MRIAESPCGIQPLVGSFSTDIGRAAVARLGLFQIRAVLEFSLPNLGQEYSNEVRVLPFKIVFLARAEDLPIVIGLPGWKHGAPRGFGGRSLCYADSVSQLKRQVRNLDCSDSAVERGTQ
ncbi:MAG: hypothetical protein ACLQAT_27910 [Candidatus Binataceae bacterium]